MADDDAAANTAAQTKPINTFITARLENMGFDSFRVWPTALRIVAKHRCALWRFGCALIPENPASAQSFGAETANRSPFLTIFDDRAIVLAPPWPPARMPGPGIVR